MTNIPLRDRVRASFLGPILRRYVLAPLQRSRRLGDARRLAKTDKSVFICPLCGYTGLFVDIGIRRYAACPNCGSAERHRLQVLVLDRILVNFDPGSKSALHFAPETFLSNRLREVFKSYKTSDLFRSDVDIQADICALPLMNDSFDLVFASHVLEHVPNDRQAIKELHRVLRSGGIAILPVPIYDIPITVEYGAPRPEEAGHVRGPSLDYFDRYREVFDEVTVFSSEDFADEACKYQLYIQPAESNKSGRILKRLPDFVPVCYKK